MKELSNIIYIFIEKHLIPTVIAVAASIFIIIVTPEDYWVVEKVGLMFFSVFVFCICFIFIQLLLKTGKKIKDYINNCSNITYEKTQIEKRNIEAIDCFNKYVDKLSAFDKELLKDFIVNGNKILITSNRINDYDSLLENEIIIDSSVFCGDINAIDKNKYWLEMSLEANISHGLRPVGGFRQFKIKDKIFHDIKLIYD